ncbi:MAG: MCE family protein [Acidobacteria bacterium]|nr:MCE family protein [Acidobacteriota bacterium]
MPSQQEVKWSQLKVGSIVLVSVTLLCALLFLMTAGSGMSVFSHKIVVTTYFKNADGLKSGAAVDLEGVTIGEVKSVQITNDPARKMTPVKVVMKLDPKHRSSLHTDSKASLSTVGVLGDTVVNISSTTAVGPELHSGAELGTLESPNLTDVVKSSQGTIESVDVILAKMNAIAGNVQEGKGTVGRLVEDPALYEKATQAIDQLQMLTRNLNEGKGSAGKLLHDDQLYDRLNDTAAKLDTIATALQAGKGTAGKLLTDDSLYNNLNETLKHTNSLMAEADAGRGGLGLLTKDPAFARKLNHSVTQLDAILTSVNQGHGTVGKLVNDDAAYANLNKLLSASTDLVTTIRQDPKKYLSINMKVF